MFAGIANFRNIVGYTNLGANMIAYKVAVADQFVNLITVNRDKTIKKEHIETAFASFKLFCNDPTTIDDAITSCKKDLAGFFFFVQIQDWN